METPKISRLVNYSDSESDNSQSPDQDDTSCWVENEDNNNFAESNTNKSYESSWFKRLDTHESLSITIEPFEMSKRIDVVNNDDVAVELDTGEFKLKFKFPELDPPGPVIAYVQMELDLNGSAVTIRIGDIFPSGVFFGVLLFDNQSLIHFMDVENKCTISVMSSSEFKHLLEDYIPSFLVSSACLFMTETLVPQITKSMNELCDAKERKNSIDVDLSTSGSGKFKGSTKASGSNKTSSVRKPMSKDDIDTSRILDS
jgi:hypothetical protein